MSSDVPALLITGAFDAVTPPSQADKAAKTFRTAKSCDSLVSVMTSSPRSDCGRQIVGDFLSRPDSYAPAAPTRDVAAHLRELLPSRPGFRRSTRIRSSPRLRSGSC